ncbi:MAG: hypothetical protein ABH877_04820, partial [bacterium]
MLQPGETKEPRDHGERALPGAERSESEADALDADSWADEPGLNAPEAGPSVGLRAGSLRNRLRLGGTALVVGLAVLLLGLHWIVLRRMIRGDSENAARDVVAILAEVAAPAVEAHSREDVAQVLARLFRLDDAVFAEINTSDGRSLVLVGDPPRDPL